MTGWLVRLLEAINRRLESPGERLAKRSHEMRCGDPTCTDDHPRSRADRYWD